MRSKNDEESKVFPFATERDNGCEGHFFSEITFPWKEYTDDFFCQACVHKCIWSYVSPYMPSAGVAFQSRVSRLAKVD